MRMKIGFSVAIIWMATYGCVFNRTALQPTVAQAQQATLQAELLYEQDYDSQEPGSTGGARDDSGWQGGRTDLTVVNGEKGRVLEAQTNGYAQIDLGHFNLEKGATYRVGVTVGSRGTQSLEMGVRKVGEPYTMHVSSPFQSFETPRRWSKFFTVTEEANPSRFQIVMRGYTTLTIDDVTVEKITGGLPANINQISEAMLLPGKPQKPDNILLNSSFELLRDGWMWRGGVKFVPLQNAFHGSYGIRMENGGTLFSDFLPLSLRNDYELVARVRAVGSRPARVVLGWGDYVNFRGGTDGASREFEVQPGQWQRVAVTWRPKLTEGQVAPDKPFHAEFGCRSGQIEIDGVEAKAVGGDAMGGVLAQPGNDTYVPAAPVEWGIEVLAPLSVVTQGEAAKAIIRCSAQDRSSQDHGAFLRVLDEAGKTVRSLQLNQPATVVLRNLQPGYYRLVTLPVQRTSRKRIEGEAFIAVVPPMPNVSLDKWHFGTHVSARPDSLAAGHKLGWRWNRLHDVAHFTKWPAVQPERERWRFDDETPARMKAAGYELLGSLDMLPAWLPKASAGREANPAELTEETFGQWREYCRRTAEHYKNSITWWEITNEPNLSGMSPEHYRRLYDEAVAGVKAGNPQAKVLALGGAVPPGAPWLAQVLRSGVTKTADAISFHFYGGTTFSSRRGPQPLREAVETQTQVMRQNKFPVVPVWDSESGGIFRTSYQKFSNPFGDTAPREGAEMMPKAVAAVLASGLERWFYYAAFNATHPGELAAFAASDINDTIKMPFQPMAVAISLLEGREFVRQENAADGIVHLVFSGRGETVHMLWKNNGQATLKAPANTRRVLNMWGRKVQKSNSLRLDTAPIYVVTTS
jgi:hypothetical protein